MKKQIILLLLTVITLASFAQDAKDILQKSYSKCKSIKNGYYEEIRQTDFTGGECRNGCQKADTFSCTFKKIENDTLFASAFNFNEIHYDYTFSSIYMGDDLILYHSNDSCGSILSKSFSAEEMKARMISDYNFYYCFTDVTKSPFPIIFNEKNIKFIFKYISEEKINNHNCYHIQVNRIPHDSPDDDMRILHEEFQFWINKEDMIPVQYSVAFDGIVIVDYDGKVKEDTMYQYEKYVLTKYEINNLKDDSKFNLTTIPSYYKLKSSVTYNGLALLAKDTVAPNFSLTSTNNEKVSLSDLKGQLLLVNFFYYSSYPSTNAIPAMQKLYDKYKGKGLKIIGINPFNKTDDDIAKNISKQGVTYPVLTDGKNTAKDYHVSYYPAIYLIDKTGKIIYSTVGYGKGSEDKLEEIIKKNL